MNFRFSNYQIAYVYPLCPSSLQFVEFSELFLLHSPPRFFKNDLLRKKEKYTFKGQ